MADIAIADVTTGAKDGTGVFDKLMDAVDIRINAEYTSGRIKGAEYATVYLGAMESAMSQAIQFVLGEQAADKQADLLAEQISSEIKQNETDGLIDKQVLDLINQTTTRGNESGAKVTLMGQQSSKTTAETLLVGEQENSEIMQNKVAGLIAAQIADLTNQTSTRGFESTAKISLMGEQEDKAIAEELLLQQKIDTEKAQILDTVNAVTVLGLIGKQKLLLAKQTDGFDRDAEQKAAKIMLDSYAVRRSTAAAEPVPARADDENIGLILSKMGTGLGVTLT